MKTHLNTSLLPIAVALAVVTLAAYSRAPGLDFVHIDDPAYVLHNAHLRDGITADAISWSFTAVHSANWHPLTWLSHALDCQLYGLKPWGHHLTNVLLHCANVVILFLVLVGMTDAVWRSAFVAALFAVHPLHVESVAWVAERKDVLSTFFWMLTMWAYLSYVKAPRPMASAKAKPARKSRSSAPNASAGRTGRRQAYLLLILAYMLGLLSKPMLVSLPLVLILLDFWPLRKSQITNLKSQIDKLPLFGLAFASCMVTFFAQRGAGAVQAADQYPIGVRLANAAVAYAAYLGKMVWPAKLSAFYPHPGRDLPAWLPIVCTIGLALITYASIRLAKSAPYVTVGWLWYLITLVPVIGLIQVGRQAMADRYTYIPLIGIFIVIAWGVPEMLARFGSPRSRSAVLGALATGIVATLSVLTWHEVGYWKNGITLMTRALKTTSGNYAVHYLLADAYSDAGQKDKMLYHYSQSARKNPRFDFGLVRYGTALIDAGDVDKGLAQLHLALKHDPEFPMAHNELGLYWMKQGKIDRAIKHFRAAIKPQPNNASAHYNLGTALQRDKQFEEAMKEFTKAAELDPNMAQPHYSLGAMYLGAQDWESGIRELKKAVALKPDWPQPRFDLACAYAAQGDLNTAMIHLEKVVRMNPDWGIPRLWYATGLQRQGNYAAAWRELHEAERLGVKDTAALRKTLSAAMPEPAK